MGLLLLRILPYVGNRRLRIWPPAETVDGDRRTGGLSAAARDARDAHAWSVTRILGEDLAIRRFRTEAFNASRRSVGSRTEVPHDPSEGNVRTIRRFLFGSEPALPSHQAFDSAGGGLHCRLSLRCVAQRRIPRKVCRSAFQVSISGPDRSIYRVKRAETRRDRRTDVRRTAMKSTTKPKRKVMTKPVEVPSPSQ